MDWRYGENFTIPLRSLMPKRVALIVLMRGKTNDVIAVLLGEKTLSPPCAIGRVARGPPVMHIVVFVQSCKCSDICCHVEWKVVKDAFGVKLSGHMGVRDSGEDNGSSSSSS
eukprot:5378264-Ditylum_brightwellii.AAC.1